MGPPLSPHTEQIRSTLERNIRQINWYREGQWQFHCPVCLTVFEQWSQCLAHLIQSTHLGRIDDICQTTLGGGLHQSPNFGRAASAGAAVRGVAPPTAPTSSIGLLPSSSVGSSTTVVPGVQRGAGRLLSTCFVESLDSLKISARQRAHDLNLHCPETLDWDALSATTSSRPSMRASSDDGDDAWLSNPVARRNSSLAKRAYLREARKFGAGDGTSSVGGGSERGEDFEKRRPRSRGENDDLMNSPRSSEEGSEVEFCMSGDVGGIVSMDNLLDGVSSGRGKERLFEGASRSPSEGRSVARNRKKPTRVSPRVVPTDDASNVLLDAKNADELLFPTDSRESDGGSAGFRQPGLEDKIFGPVRESRFQSVLGSRLHSFASAQEGRSSQFWSPASSSPLSVEVDPQGAGIVGFYPPKKIEKNVAGIVHSGSSSPNLLDGFLVLNTNTSLNSATSTTQPKQDAETQDVWSYVTTTLYCQRARLATLGELPRTESISPSRRGQGSPPRESSPNNATDADATTTTDLYLSSPPLDEEDRAVSPLPAAPDNEDVSPRRAIVLGCDLEAAPGEGFLVSDSVNSDLPDGEVITHVEGFNLKRIPDVDEMVDFFRSRLALHSTPVKEAAGVPVGLALDRQILFERGPDAPPESACVSPSAAMQVAAYTMEQVEPKPLEWPMDLFEKSFQIVRKEGLMVKSGLVVKHLRQGDLIKALRNPGGGEDEEGVVKESPKFADVLEGERGAGVAGREEQQSSSFGVKTPTETLIDLSNPLGTQDVEALFEMYAIPGVTQLIVDPVDGFELGAACFREKWAEMWPDFERLKDNWLGYAEIAQPQPASEQLLAVSGLLESTVTSRAGSALSAGAASSSPFPLSAVSRSPRVSHSLLQSVRMYTRRSFFYQLQWEASEILHFHLQNERGNSSSSSSDADELVVAPGGSSTQFVERSIRLRTLPKHDLNVLPPDIYDDGCWGRTIEGMIEEGPGYVDGLQVGAQRNAGSLSAEESAPIRGRVGTEFAEAVLQVIVLMGVPGSGKSTICTRLGNGWEVINQDDLGSRERCQDRFRQLVHQTFGKPQKSPRNKNSPKKVVTRKPPLRIVIDRTNVTRKQRKHWRVETTRAMQEYNIKPRVVCAMVDTVSKDDCIDRVHKRGWNEVYSEVFGEGSESAEERLTLAQRVVFKKVWKFCFRTHILEIMLNISRYGKRALPLGARSGASMWSEPGRFV